MVYEYLAVSSSVMPKCVASVAKSLFIYTVYTRSSVRLNIYGLCINPTLTVRMYSNYQHVPESLGLSESIGMAVVGHVKTEESGRRLFIRHPAYQKRTKLSISEGCIC